MIIRGGGSQTDLSCFDHYAIAATIAHLPLPVLTGIGHERDETITDLVAHTRLKTPTAVAAFLIETCHHFEETLDQFFQEISTLAADRLNAARDSLEKHRLLFYQSVGENPQSQQERLGQIQNTVLRQAERTVDRQKTHFQQLTNEFRHMVQRRLH